jgi:hypothetical protein
MGVSCDPVAWVCPVFEDDDPPSEAGAKEEKASEAVDGKKPL